jgi:hypothetical protein
MDLPKRDRHRALEGKRDGMRCMVENRYWTVAKKGAWDERVGDYIPGYLSSK